MPMEGSFVSADGHVVEPPDLWTGRIEPRFRDHAPRIESLPDGDYYFMHGKRSAPIMGLEGAMLNEKIESGSIKAFKPRRFSDVRRGAWEPQARLADQDLDNLRSEVIYPGIGLGFFALVEGGIGWIASLLRFMDHWWADHHHWMEPKLDEPPSFYFHPQFWATFEDDRPGLLTRELLNVDHLMWGADYPHTEGTFPRSREQVAKDFKGIPANEVKKMVSENGSLLYGVA